MKILSAILVCIVLCGCATLPPISQRESYVATHACSDRTKDAILNGKIYVGMTKEEVVASWGPFVMFNRSCYSAGCIESTDFQGWHLTFQGDTLINMSQ